MGGEAAGPRPPRAPGQIAGALRRHARRAARELAAYEAAQAATRLVGTYHVPPGEDLDEGQALAFLRSARREHPERELVIAATTVTAPTAQPQRGPAKGTP